MFFRKCKYIEKGKKCDRYITDDLSILSDKSNREYIKTKYLARSFLSRVCKIVIPQKSIGPCLKVSKNLQALCLASEYKNKSI